MHFFWGKAEHVTKSAFLKRNGGWNEKVYCCWIYDRSAGRSTDRSFRLVANHCIVNHFTHTFPLKDLSHLRAIFGHGNCHVR